MPTDPTTTPASSGICPVCQTTFAQTRRQTRRRYCSPNCRRTAWRRRQRTSQPPTTRPAPAAATGPIAIRDCPHCQWPVTIVALLVTPQAARPHPPLPPLRR